MGLGVSCQFVEQVRARGSLSSGRPGFQGFLGRRGVNIQLSDFEPFLALVKGSPGVSADWLSVLCCLRRAGSDVVLVCPIRPRLPVCPVMRWPRCARRSPARPGWSCPWSSTAGPGRLANARGLTREVSTYHGVDSAKGRVIGGGRDHEVVLAVVTTPAASLRDLHHTPTICCGRTVSRAGRPA